MISVIIATMYFLSLPGLLMGRSIFSIFIIYIQQSGYSYLWANFPSFWAIISPSTLETHSLFKKIAIIIAFIILSLGLFYTIHKKIEIKGDIVCYIAIWTIYTCVLFLPNMHDRYSYLLDVFFIISIAVNRKMLFFSIIPFLSLIILYASYLFKHTVMAIEIISIFYIVNYILYSYHLFILKYKYGDF
ncbi:hypothetical protein AXE85_01145 [Gemella sp. oral taxon 928]|nr:hypothetical protein AXE85_01145 [Gemella sp. oral taxon 928]AXI26466.1 hypothetical protein CG018_02920 [Gemella sp. ND 6198]